MNDGFISQFKSFMIGRWREDRFVRPANLSIVGVCLILLIFSSIYGSFFETPLENSLGHSQRPTILFSVINALFISPIVEEVSFRFFLTKFSVNKFIISVSMLLGYTMFMFCNIFQIKIQGVDLIESSYGVVLVTGILSYILLLLSRSRLSRLESFWNENFLFIFYLVSIFFATLHIRFVNINFSSFLIEIASIVPILFFSFITGFIRIRYSFIHCMIFHSCFNLPIVLILLLLV